jgi:tRNA dimethylallyltransferase
VTRLVKPPLIFLMGPTASGKTDLAITLAAELNCELISVDSALVYRGLDIGSAKPDYPHHLVNIRDPAEPYSVAEFCTDARAAIDDILARGKRPLLVGGTMLYFKSLLEGMARMPAADPEIRAQLEREAAETGWPALHRRLAELDPESAERIHPNHSQRLGRALEVYLSSGVTQSDWLRRQQQSSGRLLDEFSLQQLALCPLPRALLHQRIALRMQQMISHGLIDEVRELYLRGDLHPGLPAIRAVGYRQMWAYLEGDYDLEKAVDLAVIATRQLAKRQLTWLRGWEGLQWIYTNEAGFAAKSPENLESSAEYSLQLALKYLSADTT